MNGMATGTGHAVQRVTGASNVGARDALAMAGQAVVQNLVRSELRESDDGGLGRRFDVRPTGTMAAFATSPLRRLLRQRDALEVRVLVEARPDIGMTGFADIAADVVGAPRGDAECDGRHGHSTERLHLLNINEYASG